jgi:hypothetical protein
MAISEFYAALRERVGNDLLLMPRFRRATRRNSAYLPVAQMPTLAFAYPVEIFVAFLHRPTFSPSLVERRPEGAPDGRFTFLQLAMLGATAVWACLLYGGQLLIAIDVARGRRVRLRRFAEGVHHTLRLPATLLPMAVPLLMSPHVPGGAWGEALALVLLVTAVCTTLVLLARTILWAPMLVEGSSLAGALVASWRATSGNTWKLLRVALLCGLPVPLVLAVEWAVYDEYYVSSGVYSMLYCLAVAELYVALSAPQGIPIEPEVQSGAVVAVEVELPQQGTGWSRPYD